MMSLLPGLIMSNVSRGGVGMHRRGMDSFEDFRRHLMDGIYLYIYTSIYLYIYTPIYLYINLSIYLSISICIYLSNYVCIY
jgi:hypothetical protein